MSVNINSIKWSAAMLALALSLATTAALGCGGGNGNDLPEEATWESTIDTGITEKIETEAGEDDVVLGDINEHGVEIFVPGGAFQEPAQISLSGAEEEVKVDLAKYSPQSSLYSLKFTGEQPRTDLPVEVTTAVDKETLAAAEETGGYRALHYNEEFGWEHKRPVEVNQEKGYVVFETYHNFLWGTAELTEEERIDSYLDEMSQEQWARGQIGEDMEGLTKEVVDEMIMGAFDEHNPDIAQHILSEVTDEVVGSLNLNIIGEDHELKLPVGASKGMMENVYEGDYESLGISVATETGKVLNQFIEEDRISDEMGDALKYAGPVAQTLGALAEGDSIAAAEHIGEFVVDQSRILQAGRLAAEAVDMRISNWTNEEVEKAYQIYLNGTESHLPWGYDVEAGDFDSLWTQMRGVARQVRIDALERHARLHGINVDDIPADTAEQIRDQAAEDLKEQFEKRRAQEDEIAEMKDKNRYVIDRFKDWDLLDRSRDFFPDDMPVETQLNRLFGQIDRVMEDTGRTDIIYDMGYPFYDPEDEDYADVICLEDALRVIRTNYVEGRDAYEEKLVELGLVDPWDEDLSGRWEGYFRVTAFPFADDVDFDDPREVERFVEKADPGDGCEEKLEVDIEAAIVMMLQELMETLLNNNLEMMMELEETPQGNYSGHKRIGFNKVFPEADFSDWDNYDVETRYEDGVLRILAQNPDFNIRFAGEPEGENRLQGDFAVFEDDQEVMIGNWELERR